jgi:hypothetical protein
VRATATSFPLSKHTGGGDIAPAFSGQRVYLQLTWEGAFSPLLWSFPPTAAFTIFPAPDCWACAATPAFSSLACFFTTHVGSGPSPLSCGVFLPPPLLQAFPLLLLGVCHCSCLLQPGLFIYSSVRDSLPSLCSTQAVPPSLLCVFFVVIGYYSVSLFFPCVGVSLSRGLC